MRPAVCAAPCKTAQGPTTAFKHTASSVHQKENSRNFLEKGRKEGIFYEIAFCGDEKTRRSGSFLLAYRFQERLFLVTTGQVVEALVGTGSVGLNESNVVGELGLLSL